MIDLHCHILPGLDDGPVDMAESVEMARAATESGIRTVVATPHLRADFPEVRVGEIAERCQEFDQALAEAGIRLEVVPGAEVSLAWALEADDGDLRAASYGQAGNCVLIETPSTGVPMLAQLLTQIADRGYDVLLAHPERSADFQRTPSLIDQLTEQGVALQVNADALIRNPTASRSARLARSLCRHGSITTLASDAHRGRNWRPITALAEGRRVAARLTDETTADALVRQAPESILLGGPPPRAAASARRRGWRPWH